MNKPVDFDEYILGFPGDIQIKLKQLREAIINAAPEAKEVISYGMPAFKMEKMLLYFAGHKNHIGLYPYASSIIEFKKELLNYKCSKGTIQFSFDKPLPLQLITKIVRFRLKENLQKNKLEKKRS